MSFSGEIIISGISRNSDCPVLDRRNMTSQSRARPKLDNHYFWKCPEMVISPEMDITRNEYCPEKHLTSYTDRLQPDELKIIVLLYLQSMIAIRR